MIDVQRIKSVEAHDWILRKHYAKRLPSISYAFGAYRGSDLIGIVTYGQPASPWLCMGVCGEEFRSNVIELNRLVCENSKNIASKLISKSLKLLPTPKIVVSYADTGQGHVGYVYQATNWKYTGATKERTDMASVDGKHSRHNLGDSSKRQHRSSKHRYLYFVGTKKQIKDMVSKCNYKQEPYPKGESLKYDASEHIETQMRLEI